MGRSSGIVLGALLVIGVAGVVAMTRGKPDEVVIERRVVAPVEVQRSFQTFSDSTGKRLLDTLFKLGYHGGYAWDEKIGAAHANLIARTERQTLSDSVARIYEGTLTLDFHHDSVSSVPPTITLRFAREPDASRWVLMMTDGFPIDPQPNMRLASISALPPTLHSAISAAFADRAEAFDYWNKREADTTAARSRTAPR